MLSGSFRLSFARLLVVGLGHFGKHLLSLTASLLDLPLFSLLGLLDLIQPLSLCLFGCSLFFGFLLGALFLLFSLLVLR